MRSPLTVVLDCTMDSGDHQRVQIGDFVVLPMYKWYQVKDVGTQRDFLGWYAFTITRGYPDQATPWTAETLGGLPSGTDRFYASPEEAAQAAQAYVSNLKAQEQAALEGATERAREARVSGD